MIGIEEGRQCKGLTKSAGKRCKKIAVVDGFCMAHLPRKVEVDTPEARERRKGLMRDLANNKQMTTKQKNRFIRIITVTNQRNK